MEQLDGKLVQSIESKELGSLTADYAELGIDALLDDGLVKDIPILGTLIKSAKIGMNVRDRIYAKKIVGFLSKVAETSQEQRDEFIEKYCKNVKRFEETVHFILEQADRFEKTLLIGRIFKACILGDILFEDALRLSAMVNRAFWSDVQEVIETGNIENQEDNQTVDFGGFHNFRPNHVNSIYSSGKPRFELNKYGKMLVKIGRSC